MNQGPKPHKPHKTVTRVICYSGDPSWVDFILSKSLPDGRRELGGQGNFIEVHTLLPGATKIHEIDRRPRNAAELETKRQADAAEAAKGILER